jgi:hypothetical protein
MMPDPEVGDTKPSSVNTKLHWELYLVVSFEDEMVKRQVILARVTDW